MLVSHILEKKGSNVVGIDGNRSIRDAANLMTEHNIGAVLVRRDARFCGILSERDIARGIARHGGQIVDAAVELLMTADVITCEPNDQTERLMNLMTERRIRHLPVMVAGEIVGMVSIGDIIKARVGELERQSVAMQTYIAGTA